MKMKDESEKVGLKLNIQKTKIMASGPITSWEIDGETMETETDFIFLGSKITTDGDCSHEIRRCLLLGFPIWGWLNPGNGTYRYRGLTIESFYRVNKDLDQITTKTTISIYWGFTVICCVLSITVAPWITWVWTAWIHLYMDFFQSIYTMVLQDMCLVGWT